MLIKIFEVLSSSVNYFNFFQDSCNMRLFGTSGVLVFLRKGCCFDYVISLWRSPYDHSHLTFCCSSRLLLRAGEVPMEEGKVSLHLNVIQHATSGKGALLHSLRCWNLGWNFTKGWWNILREFTGIKEVGLKYLASTGVKPRADWTCIHDNRRLSLRYQ